ncbi:hypothetical protein R83H12_02357 [Fibrobacteria bacterium R8-3-H12]
MFNIPIFVITLPQATQKQRHMKERMQSLNIPFEFVEGVDGRLLSEEELQKAFDKEKSYNYYKWYRNRTGSAGIELTRIYHKRRVELFCSFYNS